MHRRITPRTSLDGLKREAKRLLSALRSEDKVGDSESAATRERLQRAHPGLPVTPTLRDVQHALAREHGFDGWTALKIAVELRVTAAGDDAMNASGIDATLVARFLDNACPDHHVRGGPDHVRARHTAMRLLARYPALATVSFSTAVVCGEIAVVERMLRDDPSLATRSDGTPSEQRAGAGGSGDLVRTDLDAKGWEPLLYLCFTRLPLATSNDNALAIARLLLDAGADPNAYFMAGDSRYTPLVGAIGEGEENRPPHPRRNALVELLLERGAEPYDIQVVYNIGFHGDAGWFLERIHARAIALGRQADWDDPDWSMLDMGGYGSGARWHLERAVKNDDAVLAEWCLSHGAGPDAAAARDDRFPKHSLYEEAMMRGSTRVADVLLRHGATASDIELPRTREFTQACLRLDRSRADAMIAEHPELLLAPEPLHEAAR
ncbi:MAG: ankyrin repeat domain-containing protein, partial [Gemmatimonadota bacterium]